MNPHVHTGSGGYHVYFKHPGWHVPTLNSISKKELGDRWPGLDIRADGGYGAFCGGNTNGPYIWVREPILETVDILPHNLRTFLGLLAAPEMRPQDEPVSPSEPHGNLERILLERALSAIAAGTGRNDAGFWLACQLRDNAFPLESAKVVLQDYVQRVPSTNSKGHHEPYTLEEAHASVRSAFAERARSPWEPSAPRTQPAPNDGGRGGADTGTHVGVATPAPQDLPDIIIGGDQLRDVTNQAIAAILRQERKNPTLFLQSARLVRITWNETKRPWIAQMGINEIKEALTHSANYYRLKKVPGAEQDYIKIAVSPPKEVAEQILARQTQKPYLPFPPLVGIVETPVLRPDGTIVDQPGYDKKTRLYYAPQEGMEACAIPSTPTLAEREAALKLIWDAIGEFSYVGDADKANALGLYLTPLIRPAVKRHVPLAIIDAPKPGSGKGLLSDGVSTIATGNSAVILTMSDSAEEMQKAITSLLIEGTTIITIDNIAGRLQSSHLEAVLTADMWRGRILGQSKMTNVPQRATWLATGNNIKIGGDLARRCYRIRLDPKVSRPWMRVGFTHSDLITWIAERRPALISALLTLARAWFVAGSPQYDHIPALGTFTGWSKTVGGILEYAGVTGFLSNLDTLYGEADEDNAQWEGFFQSWLETIGEEWVTSANLFQYITVARGGNDIAGDGDEKCDSDLAESLPANLQIALKDKPNSFKVRLGKALDRRVDECFGSENIHLEKMREKHRNLSLWRVLRGVAEVVPVTCEKKNLLEENAYTDDSYNLRNPSQMPTLSEAKNTRVGFPSGLDPSSMSQERVQTPQIEGQPLASATEWEDIEL
ncbi:hypothetical protein KDI_08940 [Dictyobacter arantiisoli]|uniref:DNA primase/polymerase bifunctional N-terminal domain-containing protein n=1 Tax=Dictyobacter arantiisoli TaxID=2014874 RepID=A0A5A5T780_9CHLR|nr:hypothetical protein KDI_08940 [Dictyobacter arantiisoli]